MTRKLRQALQLQMGLSLRGFLKRGFTRIENDRKSSVNRLKLPC
jgi:hypothetical protein